MSPMFTPGLFDFPSALKVIAKEHPMISTHRISQSAAAAKRWTARWFQRLLEKVRHGND